MDCGRRRRRGWGRASHSPLGQNAFRQSLVYSAFSSLRGRDWPGGTTGSVKGIKGIARSAAAEMSVRGALRLPQRSWESPDS